MPYYQAFGLTIRSAIAFPELLPHPEIPKTDLVIVDETFPAEAPTNLFPSYRFDVPSIGCFRIARGNRVSFTVGKNTEAELLRLFLLGSSLGCVLQQRGLIVLHGNAISLDGETCQIFVGHQGAGKSTLAAWHFLHGAKILADDVCAITFDDAGRAVVLPSFPQIKLWQISADLLGISTKGLRRIRPNSDKFALPIGKQFCRSSLPITEVVEISPKANSVMLLKGASKIERLVEHSYRYQFIRNMGFLASYQQKLIQLAGQIGMTSRPRQVL